jgi:uncharacterized DUF497 family protein
MRIYWDKDKNELLRKVRGFSFELIEAAIEKGNLIKIIDHPNPQKYKNQKMMLVEIEGYIHCVPFVIGRKKEYFLKTIYKSRKMQKYLKGKKEK